MKHFLKITLLLFTVICQAQTKLVLTPKGFGTVELKTPNKPLDDLIDASKAWVPFFNRGSYDITEVTQNSMTIDALYENAYYYYNVGVKYNNDIRYSLKVAFLPDHTYTLTLSVKEIYTKNVLLKTTVSDFFTQDGKVKDDFRDAKSSIESTVNRIIKSYSGFIAH